ncbi:MAG: TlyA family RNA methyltransferase [Deltaproteobacteria bacterium]|nr:TlyA family RNA methyltransferase [Deltaproteobacteria bacterium]
MKKVRADKRLVDSGLVKTRQEAQRRIMKGDVWLGTQRITKSGTFVSETAELRLTGEALPYVSRGGLKLEAALKAFHIDVRDRVALDIGASTGGFTDCLLQRGASRVYAVDVGYGQLDWKLRNDPRVVVIERMNARYLSKNEIPEPIHVAVIDVSFISVRKIVPVIHPLLAPGAAMIILVKPQFEVGKGEVGKGGIVKDPEKHQRVIDEITAFCENQGFKPLGHIPSPILGAKGNREFLLAVMKSWD